MALSKLEITRQADIYITNLFWKVKLYLADNSKNIDDYNIVISDETTDGGDGTGAEIISEWDDLTGLSKPGSVQLDPFNTAATNEFNTYRVGVSRSKIYPSIGDQLDLLYKDMLAGKLDTTGEWHKAIKAVKDKDWTNPNPGQNWDGPS